MEFSTGNAAFDDENDGNSSEEITFILQNVIDKVADGRTSGSILDSNGNRIGQWEFTRD
ncbi:hypothetical protein AB0K16_22200 [Nonomuraea jabiensis]|uniref:hypothetical protein n=1 Tax=Nonomuraea jabiensis TaxID=882448 RepID=UPI003446989D